MSFFVKNPKLSGKKTDPLDMKLKPETEKILERLTPMKNANDPIVPASPEYYRFSEDLKTRVACRSIWRSRRTRCSRAPTTSNSSASAAR
jgi:hypothetical protein